MKWLGLAALLLAGPAAAADTLAACDGLTITTTDDGKIRVDTEIDSTTGRLVAAVAERDRHALTIATDEWKNDITVVFVDGARPGALLLGARHIQWFTGASCPVPVLHVPTAHAAAPCKKRSASMTAPDIDLTAEARQILCVTHDQHLAARARFGLALANFIATREALRSSSSASETFDRIGPAATTLLVACLDVQEIGISTHNQGIVLWPEFAAAQCYKKLAPALDPAKQ
jgi:hypothetical protein